MATGHLPFAMSQTDQGETVFTNEQLDAVAQRVQNIGWDVPFYLDSHGGIHEASGEDAPSAWHVEGEPPPHDVEIESRQWTTVTDGLTGQHSYRGAVMHQSETVGRAVAERLTSYDPWTAFVVTSVEVMPSLDNDDPFPAGWVILAKRS